jgi:hypothetical protein
MTKASVQWIFGVEAPLEYAWHRLAEVEQRPSGIVGVADGDVSRLVSLEYRQPLRTRRHR